MSAARKAGSSAYFSCAANTVAKQSDATLQTGTASSPACRYWELHELADSLYNHAAMATPTTHPATRAAGSHTLSAGIAGASGYAGRELARLLSGHPQLSLRTAQARSDGYDAPVAASRSQP